MEVHNALAMRIKRRSLLFCQESPTTTGVAGNGEVGSSWDNVTSAFGLAAQA